MPSFSTQVSHPLDQETAVARLKGLMGALQTKYKEASDVQGAWTDNVPSHFRDWGHFQLDPSAYP